ncbi:Pertussis toxin subunit 2 [Bordetella pseudohinzii]|nr:Pertussis toxin subunit 2 [Bordetella pseudohinzii]
MKADMKRVYGALLLALLLCHPPAEARTARPVIDASLLTFQGAYGRCKSGQRMLTYSELNSTPALQRRLRQMTPTGWPIYALFDGKYLGGEYGGQWERGAPGSAYFYRGTVCVKTTKTSAASRGMFSNVTVTNFMASQGSKFCALFSRGGTVIVGGCIAPDTIRYSELYSPLRRMLYSAFLTGQALRIYADLGEEHFDYKDVGIQVFTISGISMCGSDGRCG